MAVSLYDTGSHGRKFVKKTVQFGAIAAVAAMALAACGQAPTSAPESAASGDTAQSAAAGGTTGTDIKACMVSDSGGFDDKSFNQSGYEGLQRASKELGVQMDAAESQSDQDFVPNINNMVQGGCNLIIGVGFLMADALTAAAQAHPEIKFALVDSTFTAEQPLDNARALVFNTAEAAYLAGYAAAGMTTTGTVGVYLGMKIPSVSIFADGFSDGVAEYNAANGKDVKLLGWDKEKQDGMVVGSFEDVAKGKQYTEQLIQQGADVIMPIAGPVGAGTLAAAKDAGNTMVVWVDADGFETQPDYQDIILTSVMKDIGNSVYDTVKSVKDGNFDSKNYVGTLENGGVGIAPWHNFDKLVPDDLKAKIDELKAKIIDGSLKVETVNAPTV